MDTLRVLPILPFPMQKKKDLSTKNVSKNRRPHYREEAAHPRMKVEIFI